MVEISGAGFDVIVLTYIRQAVPSSPDDLLLTLLSDDTFRRWVRTHGQAHRDRWQHWPDEHPEHAETFAQAVRMAGGFDAAPSRRLTDARRRELRRRVATLPTKHSRSVLMVRRLSVAAALVVGLLFVWQAWRGAENSRVLQAEYRTDYAALQTVVLPDSSVVTLNSHSALRFRWPSSDNAPREVWLQGEGYFEVAPRTDDGGHKVKFRVHTDQAAVDVVGTQFNVRTRSGQTEVMLREGVVRLLPHPARSDQPAAGLTLRPGERANISADGDSVARSRVDADAYVAWQEQWLIFNNTPLRDIRAMLAERYNLHLDFAHAPPPDSVRLRGRFPTRDLSLLLTAIGDVTQTTLRQEQNHVYYE